MALGKSYKNDFVGHLHSSGFGPPFLIEGSKKAQVGRLKASSYCSIWLVNLSHIRSALAPPTLSLNHLQRNLLIDWRRRCGWRPLILLPFASVPKHISLKTFQLWNLTFKIFEKNQNCLKNSKFSKKFSGLTLWCSEQSISRGKNNNWWWDLHFYLDFFFLVIWRKLIGWIYFAFTSANFDVFIVFAIWLLNCSFIWALFRCDTLLRPHHKTHFRCWSTSS